MVKPIRRTVTQHLEFSKSPARNDRKLGKVKKKIHRVSCSTGEQARKNAQAGITRDPALVEQQY